MNVSSTALATVGLILLSLSGNSALQSITEYEHLGQNEANNGLAESAKTRNSDNSSELNELVEEYCVRCHNERRLRGDLSLETFDAALPEQNAPVAERMIHVSYKHLTLPTICTV